jgi:glycosyltransferase involved in cell wall biosynthesis
VVLSLVLPAHNEQPFLEATVDELASGLRERGASFEILVVENGSTDDTAAEAGRLAREVPELRTLSLPAPDYGFALRTGLLAARGEVVVNFDVDYYDLGFLDRAVALFAGPDAPAIVLGGKRQPDSVDTRPWPRKVVTAVFAGILHATFRLSVSDTHGMKALAREQVTPLAEACQFGTDLFDTELVIRSERAGLRIVELPVVVEERRPARTPITRRAARTVVGIVRLRLLLWREGRGR